MAKKRKKAAKRELIDTGRDKRYVRRGAKGRFKESDDVGRSFADRRRKPRPEPSPARAIRATGRVEEVMPASAKAVSCPANGLQAPSA